MLLDSGYLGHGSLPICRVRKLPRHEPMMPILWRMPLQKRAIELMVHSRASAADEGEIELDDSFLEIMVASEDQDALQVQAFEEELENFFQDTPELQEALVSYIEARSRLLAKKKSRGFWPIGAGKGSTKGGRGFKGSGKGKGKHREQLLASYR